MSTIQPLKEVTIAFNVTDRSKTAKWYHTHFGFTELYCVDEAGWTELKTNIPGVTIGLGDTYEVSAGNCVPVFGVENIKKARATLEKESVQFDGDIIHIEGMVSVTTLYDPDGNALMLAETP